MGKWSAAGELFLGNMGSIQAPLLCSKQRRVLYACAKPWGVTPEAMTWVSIKPRYNRPDHSGFLSRRSISSYEGTWVLSCQDSSTAPQTVQIASPVCGTKNFSSVRLYSAPQLH